MDADFPSRVMKKFRKLVEVAQHCECTICHQVVQFKMVNSGFVNFTSIKKKAKKIPKEKKIKCKCFNCLHLVALLFLLHIHRYVPYIPYGIDICHMCYR